ncbi:MAG: hypothetical protein QNJ72_12790 [Pleurocapsa sp. MO_226.B13]|nr:hypothetical protein [Pleurocapsa sp. MO_226.B13]
MSNVIPFNNISTNSDTNSEIRRASFYSQAGNPIIQSTARVHPLAAVTGNVHLGKRVTVAPAASIRGYESQVIWVGNDVKIQDGAVLHALEASQYQDFIEEAVVEVEGEFYGVYIDDGVTLTHQSQVHGPASIGADTYIGMQSLVFKAIVGSNCIIEPKALVMGVEIGDGRYVPAGALITTQAAANALPYIDRSYTYQDFSRAAVSTNNQLATGYQPETKPKRKSA